jgi:dTDP-4-amino-4,6-dideoxygalactose transaminase
MKFRLADLALLGAAPAFTEELHVGRPNVPVGAAREQLLDEIASILDRRWLSNGGPKVREFEREIARLTGARHAIAVCNATQGLQVVARACNLTGEVIVPAFTFIATAHALSWIGLEPVFAEADPLTHSIDPEQIERLITPRTSGIVATHLWGEPCQVEEIEALAARNGLQVIYDAAHAFGSSHRGRMTGTFGAAEVFSFHATKFINAFEGGAITTNDDALAARLRRMISFGFADYDYVADFGTNAKMNEASAAMGLISLATMDEIISANRANYLTYQAALRGVPGVRLFEFDEREARNYQYIVLEVADAGLSRDQLLAILWSEGIRARRYFYPGCHRMEPYASAAHTEAASLPVTERLAASVLALPTGTAISPAQVAEICAIIRLALSHADDVARRLENSASQSEEMRAAA